MPAASLEDSEAGVLGLRLERVGTVDGRRRKDGLTRLEVSLVVYHLFTCVSTLLGIDWVRSIATSEQSTNDALHRWWHRESYHVAEFAEAIFPGHPRYAYVAPPC